MVASRLEADDPRPVLLLSGGIDSSSLAYLLKHDGLNPIAVHIAYGQPTEAAEWAAVLAVCNEAQMEEPLRLEIPRVLPWASELERRGTLRREGDDYIPSRNMMLISFGSMCAYSLGLHRIMIGLIAGQSSSYPDTTAEFLVAANELVHVEHPCMRIEAPLLGMGKAEALRAAISCGMSPALTFSCNRASKYHCQECGSCTDRFSAMREVGLF